MVRHSEKYVLTTIPSKNDMIDSAGKINARFSEHGKNLKAINHLSNLPPMFRVRLKLQSVEGHHAATDWKG